MANVIQLKGKMPPGGILWMSNALTDVFFDVLALSGSRLARTEGEERLIVWLSVREQRRRGAGTVGFDLREMPWEPRSFSEDRAFLLEAVAAAKERLGWESLDYAPNEALLFPCLDQFGALLSSMDAGDIKPDGSEEWTAEPGPGDVPLCPRHGVLLTEFGCPLCGR